MSKSKTAAGAPKKSWSDTKSKIYKYRGFYLICVYGIPRDQQT